MRPSALRHDLLPYSGPGGFAAAVTGPVRDAAAAGATPVVVADAEQIAALRRSLGAAAAAVIGVDRSVAGRNPARVLPALMMLVDVHDNVRCVVESIRPSDPDALVSEARLCDLVLQLPDFAGWNCHLTCVYDTDGLDARVVDSIRACHTVADPADAVDRARAQPLVPRPMSCEELGVDRTTLSALRGFIGGRAAKAGLDDERVDDLVYAVNEVVTNSICHGEGRARVSFWAESDAVLCEVRDRGWVRDPLAGRIAPGSDSVGGRGLWLVNQLCDLVQLRSSPAGTTVRLLVDT